MHGTTHRRLCGVLGAGLLLLAGGVVAVVGRHVLRTPTMMAQLGLLTVSGALDIVAAFENPLTARIDWFRLGGLANVALGLALPVGALGWTTARDATGLFLFVVTAVGGCALAAIGVDLWLAAGAHVYDRPLDADGN